MRKLSDKEQKLYTYVKQNKQVTLEQVRKNLGEEYLGALGKLQDVLETTKVAQSDGVSSYGYYRTFVKVIRIKKGKQ